MSINTLISGQELLKWMSLKQQDLVILDATSGDKAYDNYLKEHIKGAVFVDMHDLARQDIDPAKGGRHPLPRPYEFSLSLQKWGIEPKSYVVVYDTHNGSNAASRLWWMLQSIGHTNSFVLDGGLQSAKQEGIALSEGLELGKDVDLYGVKEFAFPSVTIDKVIQQSKSIEHLVVDVRAKQRYDGILEPIDLVAGHIPGAINLPFEINLQENGKFLSPKQLKDLYSKEFGEIPIENITIHCGSGVTACHTILAIAHSGLGIPNLYVGSWSEYSRGDLPIAKK